MSSSFNFIKLILLVSLSVYADNVFDGKESDNLDGNAVMEFGHALRNPLVKFIGAVVKSLESNMNSKLAVLSCRLPSCLDWSVWSECIHIKANFGIQNRTKMCETVPGAANCSLSKGSNNITEYETRLCEMQKLQEDSHISTCPKNYTRTEHGFCVMLKRVKKLGWDKAQSDCESDGGNIINVDSLTKSEDIAKTFKDLPDYTLFWIDGVQQTPEADWEVKSGANNSYYNWKNIRPKKGRRFPRCRLAEKGQATEKWKWHAYYPCSAVAFYICEIAL